MLLFDKSRYSKLLTHIPFILSNNQGICLMVIKYEIAKKKGDTNYVAGENKNL